MNKFLLHTLSKWKYNYLIFNRKLQKNIFFSNFVIFFIALNEKSCTFAAQIGGTVAQLVEQRTENPRVTGSIPVGTTRKEKAGQCSAFFVCLLPHKLRHKKSTSEEMLFLIVVSISEINGNWQDL